MDPAVRCRETFATRVLAQDPNPCRPPPRRDPPAPTHFLIVRWSAHFGPESPRIVRGRCPKPHALHGVGSGAQGRNRTIDTRIFSTTESAVRRGKAEEAGRVFDGPTEPPSPTEPIPNQSREGRTGPSSGPCGSTAYAHHDRTLSEPRADRGPAESGSPPPRGDGGGRVAVGCGTGIRQGATTSRATQQL